MVTTRSASVAVFFLLSSFFLFGQGPTFKYYRNGTSAECFADSSCSVVPGHFGNSFQFCNQNYLVQEDHHGYYDLGVVFVDSRGDTWVGGDALSYKVGSKWTVIDDQNFFTNSISGEVADIVEDANGNIWVLVDLYDLYMYDGSGWTYVQLPGSISALDIRLEYMCVDLSGDLWVVGRESSNFFVLRNSGGNWQIVNASGSGWPQITATRYSKPVVDPRDGSVYFPVGKAVYKYSGGNISSLGGVPNANYAEVTNMVVDDIGNQWWALLGSPFLARKDTGGFWHYYTDTNSTIQAPAYYFHNWRKSAIAVSDGEIWYASGDIQNSLRVSRFNGNTWDAYDSSNTIITGNATYGHLVAVNNGTIYLGSDKLYKFDGSSWSVEAIDSSGFNMPWPLLSNYDSQGNLWTTDEHGLAVNKDSVWEYFEWPFQHTAGHSIGLDDYLIDHNDEHLLTLDDLGILKFDGSNNWTVWDSTNSPLILGGHAVESIDQGPDGSYWVGTHYGLHWLNGSAWTSFTTSNSDIPFDDIGEVAVDDSNRVWFSPRVTSGLGLVEFDGIQFIVHDSLRPPGLITTIEFGLNGVIWGLAKSGSSYALNKYNGVFWELVLPECPGFHIRSISVNNAGTVFVGMNAQDDNLNVGTLNGVNWNCYSLPLRMNHGSHAALHMTAYENGNKAAFRYREYLFEFDNNVVSCTNQHISIREGWNIISGYIMPDNPDMLNILSNSSDILLLKDENGQTVIPSLMINNVGNWDITKGYKVKASQNTLLRLGCSQVDPGTTPISLATGWGIVSYLRTSPLDIATAINGIQGNVIIVKNQYGNTYIPGLGINTIGDMQPGQGYRIKMSNADVLYYPSN